MRSKFQQRLRNSLLAYLSSVRSHAFKCYSYLIYDDEIILNFGSGWGTGRGFLSPFKDKGECNVIVN